MLSVGGLGFRGVAGGLLLLDVVCELAEGLKVGVLVPIDASRAEAENSITFSPFRRSAGVGL